MKKYVPRSIQNIHDRIEAFNESITEKLFSEPLPTTFEVIIYSAKTSDVKVPPPKLEGNLGINNYYFFKARSLSGHHDHLTRPESATSLDQYEKFRNAHFQAIVKKSDTSRYPQTGDVWLATETGANLVTLISFERSTIMRFNFSGYGGAKGAHTSGGDPTRTSAEYAEMTTEMENMMNRNKKSRDFLKDQLRVKFAAEGIPFHITSEVRNVNSQVNVLKKMYTNSGRDEVLYKYGKNGLGKQIVAAIEAGDDIALRVAAQKSTRHLRGLAIDIRTKNLSNDQVNKAINIVKGLGLFYILEQTKTGCWDKPGRNVTNVKRLAPPGGGRGEPCYAEHLHVSIPESYGL